MNNYIRSIGLNSVFNFYVFKDKLCGTSCKMKHNISIHIGHLIIYSIILVECSKFYILYL